MEITKLKPHEIDAFSKLIDIFKEVFENDAEKPEHHHLGKLLANPDFMVFVVKMDNQVVGGLTIYVLHRYYGTKPVAYIYDVGVAPAFQRKGLGKALMTEVGKYCKANNFEDMYVEAESDDIDAVEFYRRTNADNEMNATHFTYSFTAI
jgi:aminoglycoside 3-N-acetyltransferase I